MIEKKIATLNEDDNRTALQISWIQLSFATCLRRNGEKSYVINFSFWNLACIGNSTLMKISLTVCICLYINIVIVSTKQYYAHHEKYDKA